MIAEAYVRLVEVLLSFVEVGNTQNIFKLTQRKLILEFGIWRNWSNGVVLFQFH